MGHIKHLRWYIVGFICLATVINYVDRMAFNLTTPKISYVIVAAFQDKDAAKVKSSAIEKLTLDKEFVKSYKGTSPDEIKARVAKEVDRRISYASKGTEEKPRDEKKSHSLAELIALSVNSAIEDIVKKMLSVVMMAFQIGYILGPTPLGALLDRLGVRKGYPITMALWSAAGILTVWSVQIGAGIERFLPLGVLPVIAGFGLCRFVLGFGEAGNWPAAIKTIGEWFPTKERSLAMGWFNSGSSMGAFLAPVIVGLLVTGLYWQPVFIVVGVAGFIWIAGWMAIYHSPEKHPRLSKEEYEYINQDRTAADLETTKLPWWEGLKYRQVRGVLVSRFFSEMVWWFCQQWLPLYFVSERGVDFKKMAVFMVLTFFASDLGNIFGGWLSSYFLKKGWTINKSRKTVMAPCGILMFSAFLVPYVSTYAAVGILSLVTFCYQAWSVNMQTIPADVVPRRSLASTAGLAHMTAGLAGFAIANLAGNFSYIVMFRIIAVAAVMAVTLLFVAIGRIDPEIKETQAA